jgi:hypothetical protein
MASAAGCRKLLQNTIWQKLTGNNLFTQLVEQAESRIFTSAAQ